MSKGSLRGALSDAPATAEPEQQQQQQVMTVSVQITGQGNYGIDK